MPALVRPVHDERDALLAFLDQQRLALRAAAHGLDEVQARQAPTVSDLSVGGLVRHCLETEAQWTARIPGAGPGPVPVDGGPAAYVEGFHLAADDTLAAALARYDAVADHTRTTVTAVPLDAPVPVPRDAPWFPAGVTAWSVRWVVLHLVAETARHAGHADLVREAVDGGTAYPLLAAVEGWPATPWLTPWTPPVR